MRTKKLEVKSKMKIKSLLLLSILLLTLITGCTQEAIVIDDAKEQQEKTQQSNQEIEADFDEILVESDEGVELGELI